MSTDKVPTPPGSRPTLMTMPDTVPWFETESDPVPLWPTEMRPLAPLAVSALPTPVTVTLPVPPGTMSLAPPM